MQRPGGRGQGKGLPQQSDFRNRSMMNQDERLTKEFWEVGDEI